MISVLPVKRYIIKIKLTSKGKNMKNVNKKLKQNWWIIAGFVVVIGIQIATTAMLCSVMQQRDQDIMKDVLNLRVQLMKKNVL